MQPFPAVPGISHRFVQTRRLRIHLAQAGSGPPLLMLHGWPQHWYMWRHQIPPLAEHYTILCPDLRGFGWSDAPAAGYEKEPLVDDVLALLDALGIDRVRLVGHDWGGWVGFLLCLRQPARVGRFLALNVPHPYQRLDTRHLALWRFWYQLLIACPLLGQRMVQHPAGIARWLLQRWLVNRTWTADELSIYTSRFREPARAAASVMLYRGFLLREFMPIIRGRYLRSRLSVPSLLLFGARDTAISPRLLTGHEPYTDQLRIELIPDAGHCIAEDRPDLVTQRALEFFAAA